MCFFFPVKRPNAALLREARLVEHVLNLMAFGAENVAYRIKCIDDSDANETNEDDSHEATLTNELKPYDSNQAQSINLDFSTIISMQNFVTCTVGIHQSIIGRAFESSKTTRVVTKPSMLRTESRTVVLSETATDSPLTPAMWLMPQKVVHNYMKNASALLLWTVAEIWIQSAAGMKTQTQSESPNFSSQSNVRKDRILHVQRTFGNILSSKQAYTLEDLQLMLLEMFVQMLRTGIVAKSKFSTSPGSGVVFQTDILNIMEKVLSPSWFFCLLCWKTPPQTVALAFHLLVSLMLISPEYRQFFEKESGFLGLAEVLK